MIVVFYEDQRGPRNEFGLHRLVCQLVIDHAGLADNVFKIEKSLIHGIPLKGNGKLFKRCKKDLPRLSNQTKKVFAVFDQDRLPELLGLKGNQCRGFLRGKLMEPCEPRDAIEFIFVDRNIESVIEALRDSGLVSFIDDKLFEGALDKKQLTRDSLFIQCAMNTTPELRMKLLDELPDIKRLVTKIAECV